MLAAVPAARAQVAGLTGTLVVTNKTPSTATIVDVASGRTLATLPTGTNPHEVVLSSDGALAVITDYGGPRRTLTVIDVPGLKRRAHRGPRRAPGAARHRLPAGRQRWSPSPASRPATSCSSTSSRASSATPSPTEAAGSHMIGVTADGTRGYTGNMGDHTVSELDLSAHRFVRSFPVPAGARGDQRHA